MACHSGWPSGWWIDYDPAPLSFVIADSPERVVGRHTTDAGGIVTSTYYIRRGPALIRPLAGGLATVSTDHVGGLAFAGVCTLLGVILWRDSTLLGFLDRSHARAVHEELQRRQSLLGAQGHLQDREPQALKTED